MASIAARLTVIGENGYGEPEQDANSALTELDKGLRSGKIGEQCEAIVRFPRLFEKYPFPILINSAFLKLADVFRIGNNFLRLCILKVTQQSEKHLDKILNVDEFVRRIFSVIHSNDPIARSLTLRTLGSIASIIPEWKNVHHSIRISLDSHDSMELQAAIFAVEKFAAQSRTFASNICSKIGQMIEGLATPSNIKLELIAILQHMHHDAETAAVVRKLCTDLLPKYPTQEFVTVILNTLTQLSAASLLFIEDQVTLLMDYMHTDVRNVVKMSSLKNLKILVKKCAQFWKQEDIKSLCSFAISTPYSELKYVALDVLATMAQSIAVANFNVSSDSIYLHLCDEACYDQNLHISSKAVELLAHLAVHIYQEDREINGLDIYEEAVVAVESLLLAATVSQLPSRMKALKLGLVCAVILCEAKNDACQPFVNSIGSLITTSTGPCAILMCEALAAIANRKVGVLSLLLPELIQRLEEMPNIIKKDRAEAKTLVMMIVLLFQGLINHPSESHAESVVKKAIPALDLWDCYKVARQAARYGHHHIAADIFVHLSNRVCSEHFHFWLVALSEFCCGESFLQSQVKKDASQVEYVAAACVYYMKGISALKAATTPTNLLQFQCEYVRLRADVLQAHAQLARTCTSLKTSPPPAIAAAVATATRDELQRCGRITLQLRKCVREFRNLGDQYGRLYQSVFDADPITLLNLQVLQQNCFLIAHAIDSIALKVQNLGFLEEPMSELGLGSLRKQGHTLETFGLLSAAQEAVAIVTNFNQQNDLHKLIGHQHIDELLRVSKVVVDVPLCFPRYFFQSLQSTSIKLAISPQPRALGEPVNIQNHCHLALKVEGVVQHGAKQGLFRKVQSITLNISSALQSRTQPTNELKIPSDLTNNIMTQTVEPHNDYFNSQFLLAFPIPGLHVITVEVSVIDEMENVWKTGPRSSLTIKSFDDTASQKQPQSSSSRMAFQQRF